VFSKGFWLTSRILAVPDLTKAGCTFVDYIKTNFMSNWELSFPATVFTSDISESKFTSFCS